MNAMAGTIAGASITHFATSERKTFTISPFEPTTDYVTLAFSDAEDDSHSAMLVPREQFDLAVKAYFGA